MQKVANSTGIRSKRKSTQKSAFNAQDFLDSAGVARNVTDFGKRETIFSQGDPATNVLYIQKGGVRLSIVNEAGKEAVVAVLGPGDFFGEGCLAGQPIRIGTAHCDYGHDGTGHRKEGNDPRPAQRARIFRPLHHLHAFAQHPY
jgi:CRP-like cAMP-binding protein